MRYIFIMFLSVNSLGVFAQQDSFDILRLVYELPPLEELLDTAINRSQMMKGRIALNEVKEAELQKMQYDYLDLVNFQAGTSYGNAALSTMQTGFSEVILSSNSTVRFSVGLNLSFSPAYWARRKQEIRVKKSHLAYEKSMQETSKSLIKGQLIEAYLNLEYYRDAFAIANAAYESNEATVLLAEKKFLEGDIGIDIYNDIHLKHSKMALETENLKRNLKQAFYQLEIAVGKPLVAFLKKG